MEMEIEMEMDNGRRTCTTQRHSCSLCVFSAQRTASPSGQPLITGLHPPDGAANVSWKRCQDRAKHATRQI